MDSWDPTGHALVNHDAAVQIATERRRVADELDRERQENARLREIIQAAREALPTETARVACKGPWGVRSDLGGQIYGVRSLAEGNLLFTAPLDGPECAHIVATNPAVILAIDAILSRVDEQPGGAP